MAEENPVGRARPGAGHRPGSGQQRCVDVRLDEPRRASQDGRAGRGRLLEPLAQEAVAQGRGVRPRAEGAGNPPRLRRRRGAAEDRTGRRHRLPYRPPFLLLPEVRRRRAGRRLAEHRAGAERPVRNLHPRHRGENQSKEIDMSTILDRLADIIESRKLANGGDPATSYTSKLFAKGDDAILKKIGEEATETVMAAKDARVDGDNSKVLYECADLWFHTLVMLAQFDLTPQQVLEELARREGVSGIEEKAARKDELRDAAESEKHH